MRSVVALALALVGCVPYSSHTTTTLDRRFGTPVVVERQPVASTEVAAGFVRVTVKVPRRCQTPVIDAVSVRDTTTVELVGTHNGARWGYGVAAGLVIMWPLGIAALGISVVSAASKHDGTTRHDQVVARLERACDVPGVDLPVRLGLRSGRSIDGRTGLDGTWVVAVPVGDNPTVATLIASGL